MKKRLCSFWLALVLVIGLIPSPTKVLADIPPVTLDRVEISVDTPVDGLELKTEAYVHVYSDFYDRYYYESNLPVEILGATWTLSDSDTRLAEGAKAALDTTYRVQVTLKAKEGYAFPDDLATCPCTFNGQTVTPTRISGEEKDSLNFTLMMTAQAALPGPLAVEVKDTKLSPYEGNPAEITVEATGGTNIRYQWQIVYDSQKGAQGERTIINLEDSERYQGSQTPHFRLHSYFGDNLDERLDFAKIRCEITSDNGTVYSPEFWYHLVDRSLVQEVAVTGLEIPELGETPDFTVEVDPAIASVSKVEWKRRASYSPAYDPMTDSTFIKGDYRCLIYLDPADEYKFDRNTAFMVNGKKISCIIESGENANPTGPDSYCIRIYYRVLPPLKKAEVALTLPLAGQSPYSDLSSVKISGTGYSVDELRWTHEDGSPMKDGETFVADTAYRCVLKVCPTENYTMPVDQEEFAGYINGQKATVLEEYSKDFSYIAISFTVSQIVKKVEVQMEPPVARHPAPRDLSTVQALSEVYRVVGMNWLDDQGAILPEDQVLELGKEYRCVLEIETTGERLFPENRADFKGFVNKEKATVSQDYTSQKVYLEYSFTAGLAIPYGDVNESNHVDAADALMALQHAVKLIALEGDTHVAADVNGDGVIDATDALLILQYTVLLIDSFPVENV